MVCCYPHLLCMVTNLRLPGFQVKYERAGSRANKLLKPIGLSLPEAKDNSFLLRRTPSASGAKLLGTRDINDPSVATSSSPARLSDVKTIETSPEVGESTIAKTKSNVWREASARREPTPPAPDMFGVLGKFRRKDSDAKAKPTFPDSRVAGPNFELALAATLASELDVLRKELLQCVEAVDAEVRLQERGVRAANAVLCSTEPISAGLEENLEREEAVRAELQNVARNVQQVYVLAEMTEAVEAAETYVGRLKELSANVFELTFELKAYVATGNVRYGGWFGIVESITVALPLEARGVSFCCHYFCCRFFLKVFAKQLPSRFVRSANIRGSPMSRHP